MNQLLTFLVLLMLIMRYLYCYFIINDEMEQSLAERIVASEMKLNEKERCDSALCAQNECNGSKRRSESE